MFCHGAARFQSRCPPRRVSLKKIPAQKDQGNTVAAISVSDSCLDDCTFTVAVVTCHASYPD